MLSDIVNRILHGTPLFFHEYRDDVVSGLTSGLFEVIRVDILKERIWSDEGLWQCGLDTDIGPADVVASGPVCIHEHLILVDLIFQVNSQDVFSKREAEEDGTVISAVWQIRCKAKNLSTVSKFGFSGDALYVTLAEIFKALDVLWSSEAKESSTESRANL